MLANSAEEPLTRPRAHFEFLPRNFSGPGCTRGCVLGNFGNEMADHSTAVQDAVEAGLSQRSGAIAGVCCL